MKHWALRAVRSSALVILAEIFARAANTIFFVILTWRLGENEASTYVLGFAFAGFLLQFSLGGLDQLLNREVARDPDRGGLVLGNFLAARLTSSLLCFAGLSLWLSGPYGYAPHINHVILLLGATLIPDSLIALCQSYLIARERAGYITTLGLVTGAFKLGLGSLILVLGGDAVAVAYVVLATSIIALVLFLWLITTRFERPTFSLDRHFWVQSIRTELPLYGIALMATLEGRLDTLLLSRNGNHTVVGVYGAATSLLGILLIVPQTYRQVVIPLMARWYGTVRERALEIFIQSERFLLIGTLLLVSSLAFAADEALPILFHHRFQAATPVFQTLIWSFVFICLAVPNGRLMLVAGRQAASVPMQAGSLALNLGLNLWLQPLLSAQGAALARVASSALIFVWSLVYVQRHIHRWSVWPIVSGPLGATLALLITLYGLQWVGVYWLLALMAGWIVFAVILCICEGISVSQLRSMVSVIRRQTAQAIMSSRP